MDTTSLWTACAAGDTAARDALLHEHLSLVHFVAKQLSRSLSAQADADEMVNIGTLGLMAALESFDASRGLAFSTYAVPRIRGAILDELRRLDHVPRSVRRKTRELSQAREAFMSAHGRAPSARELAERAGIDTETLWRWESDIERTTHVSIDTGDADAQSPIDVLSDPGATPDVRMQQEETVEQLRESILMLKAQQRTVLSLYYFEELNAREIAAVIGVSESRVSQIRSRALADLRAMMAPHLAVA